MSAVATDRERYTNGGILCFALSLGGAPPRVHRNFRRKLTFPGDVFGMRDQILLSRRSRLG
jgi:hypothetical protein